MCLYFCMLMWMHVNMSASIKRPEVSDEPGAGVIGSHEPPNAGAGDSTPVLYKSRTHS